MNYPGVLKKIVSVIACGIIVSTLIIAFSDVRNISDVICQMDVRCIPLILILVPLNYCIKCLRYHYYLKLANIHVSVKDEIITLLASSVMVITPGKVGEMLLRGYLLKQRGYAVPMLTICAMTLADRLTEGLAMAILAAVTFSKDINYWIILIIVTVLVVMAAVLQNKRLFLKILQYATRQLPRLENKLATVRRTYEQFYIIFKIVPMAVSVLLGTISCICEAGVIYFTVISMGSSVSLQNAVFAFSFSGIIGAVSMIPGGIGIADGTIMGLLIWCGLEKTTAGMVTIISRFSTIWLGVLVGCGLLLIIHPLQESE